MSLGCLAAPLSDGLAVWLAVYLTDLTRYLVPATLFYLGLWVWRRQPWRHRRIQDGAPQPGRLRGEFVASMRTVLIFSLNGLALVYAHQAGLTRIYGGDGGPGDWLAWTAGLLALIVLHDAYFYWTHRLMHHPRLFRRLHLEHHRSRSPSPWAAYAFSPGEALVQAAFFDLAVLLVPLQPSALFVFLAYMILRNVAGHCGYELFPAAFARHPLLRWHTTVTHHDLHHLHGVGNYGLYFSWWDRLLGTERTGYVQAVEAVTSRPKAA